MFYLFCFTCFFCIFALVYLIITMAKSKKEYDWSKYQLSIFDFVKNGQGNAVVEACAGSGKTSSLVKCLDFINEDKRILLTAFNKDIVNVLSKKTKGIANVNSMTMHGLGLQMIHSNFRREAMSLDEFKYRTYVSSNIMSLSSINTFELPKRDYYRYIDNICKFIDFGRYYLSQTIEDLDFIEDRYEIDTIADEKAIAIQSMEWGKRNLDTIDYTDMVWLPNALMCQPYGLKYDWIFCDECMPYETLVTTDKGQIQLGKLVELFNDGKELPLIKSYNEHNGTFEYKSIVNAWDKGKRETITLLFDDDKKITCTKNHKILTSNGYVMAGFLKEGDIVFTDSENNDTCAVTEVFDNGEIMNVYDIEVADNHNFIATNDDSDVSIGGVIVHNCQDLNRAQRELMLKCRKINTRMLIFGDAQQCQPEGTKVLLANGVEKNIEDIQVGDSVVTYDTETCNYVFQTNHNGKSFQVCNKVLDVEHHEEDEIISITTSSGKESSYTPSHLCYAKLNEAHTNNVYCTYIVKDENGLYFIGSASLCDESCVVSLNHLFSNVEYTDVWLLDVFDDVESATAFERSNSLDFSIARLFTRFEDKKHETYEWVNESLEERVKKCLSLNKRNIDYPFISKNKCECMSADKLTTVNACNLLPKVMMVNIYNENGGKDEVIESIEHSNSRKKVYSLSVETNHNYVADGILTHNCLYSFAGGDPDSFNALKSLPNTISLPLSISYRCADDIVSYAKQLVPTIEQNNDGRKGVVKNECDVEDVQDGDMVLCRNNAPLMKMYNQFIKEGKKCFVRGKDIGNNLKRLVKNTKKENLGADLKTDGVFVRLYNNLFDARDNLIIHSNIDVDTAMQSALMSNKLDMIRALEVLAEGLETSEELIDRISDVFSDRKKNGIALSTIHKAKGLEADRVFIACNSLMPSKSAKKDWEIKQEYNLMYVAYTRAKNFLGFINEDDFKDYQFNGSSKNNRLAAIEEQVCKVLGKKQKYLSADTAYSCGIVKNATKIVLPKSNTKTLDEVKNRVQVKPSFVGLFGRKITKKKK